MIGMGGESERRTITVGDVDPLIERYRVLVCDRGRLAEIGSKWGNGNYQKAEWYGQSRVPKDQRKYKKTPLWFEREIESIDDRGGIRIVVKEKRQ